MIVPNFLWNLALKNALIECLSRFVAWATWFGERVGGVQLATDVFTCGDLAIPDRFSQVGHVAGASLVHALQLAEVGDVSYETIAVCVYVYGWPLVPRCFSVFAFGHQTIGYVGDWSISAFLDQESEKYG